MENQPNNPNKHVSFTDVRPPSTQPTPTAEPVPESSVQNDPPVTPQQPVVSGKPRKSGKGKKVALVLLLCVLIAAGAFAAAYFWQDSKNKETAQQLETANAKVASLEKQTSTAKAESQKSTSTEPATLALPIANPYLVPGDVNTTPSNGKISVVGIFKFSAKPTALWVEYGTDPAALTSATTKITEGLGAGEGAYSLGNSFTIDSASLKPGTTYYYRTAATINDQTQQGSVASFVTAK